MNKLIRFVFMPIFFTVFLSSYAWAIDLTGTYKVAKAFYAKSTSASCQSAAITVNITSLCGTGRVLKGSITIGTNTILVSGRLYNNNTTIFLDGFDLTTFKSTMLMGSYNATTKTIKVINGTFDFSPLGNNTAFDDFTLTKVP